MLQVQNGGCHYATRNRMVDIPQHFGKTENCVCGIEETMSHIYYCDYLNIEEIQQKEYLMET